MGALLGIFRAAIPWAASILGGYVVGDVFNTVASKKAMNPAYQPNYPAEVQETAKRNRQKWMFFGIGGLLVGGLVAFLTKKFK